MNYSGILATVLRRGKSCMSSYYDDDDDDDDEFIPPGAKHLEGTALFTSQSVHTPQ